MNYIDKNGQIVSNTIVYPNNNIYAYCEDGKWGYKNKDGKIIISPVYDLATDLDEFGFAGILLDEQWGVVNSKGEVIKQPTFNLEIYYLPTFVGEYLLEVSSTYHCLELD